MAEKASLFTFCNVLEYSLQGRRKRSRAVSNTVRKRLSIHAVEVCLLVMATLLILAIRNQNRVPPKKSDKNTSGFIPYYCYLLQYYYLQLASQLQLSLLASQSTPSSQQSTSSYSTLSSSRVVEQGLSSKVSPKQQ